MTIRKSAHILCLIAATAVPSFASAAETGQYSLKEGTRLFDCSANMRDGAVVYPDDPEHKSSVAPDPLGFTTQNALIEVGRRVVFKGSTYRVITFWNRKDRRPVLERLTPRTDVDKAFVPTMKGAEGKFARTPPGNHCVLEQELDDQGSKLAVQREWDFVAYTLAVRNVSTSMRQVAWKTPEHR